VRSLISKTSRFMELSRFTDYSLRVLMYTAARSPEKVTLRELADSYRVSQHHLVKIVHKLGTLGYLRNQRGRSGGVYLGRAAEDICVGDVVRHTETHLNLVECFSAIGNHCCIAPACQLKGVLFNARDAFLTVLDACTIADLVKNRAELLRLIPPKNTT
jgi:Rrf2 family nitric oxide-sensitive transcriptional repressor